MAEQSRYQQNIIKNYYQNREAISLQRLQETVTDLYLAQGKKRAQQWKRAAPGEAGPQTRRIQQLVDKDIRPGGQVIEQWMAKQ
jgi:hypothetical protein